MAAAAEPTTVSLAYAQPGADGSFYRYMYKQEGKAPGPNEFIDDTILPGTIRADPSVQGKTRVFDARSLGGRETLAEEGFTLKRHSAPIAPIELATIGGFEEWCHHELLPKTSEIARTCVEESFGEVAAVHTIDYALRATDDIGKHMNFEPPVMEAHGDFTPESAKKRVQNETVKFRVGDQARITLADRIVMVNVWQPVVDTVYRKPLVVCDKRSVGPDDLVVKKMIFEHREGQVYNVRQNDAQKWYCYRHMRSTEALCFLTMDMATNTATPHSGVLDSSDPEDSPARRSMEVRFIVKLKLTGAPPAKQPRNDKSIDDWSAKQEVGISAMTPPPKDMWQILYWPAKDADGKVAAGAGRAEYLRVLFEEAGVPYQDVTAGLRAFFWQNLEAQPYPALAPPAIRKNNFILGQTAVCAKRLAMEFGFYPTDEDDAAHAEQIVTTVHEYIAEGRSAFHPVKNTMSYHDQKEEAKPYIAAFKADRLPRYMTNFERFLKANRGGGGFFVGDSLSYVDLQVMVMLQVTRSQFPDAWEALDAKLLKDHLAQMEARPRIKAYLLSDRKQPFAGDSMM